MTGQRFEYVAAQKLMERGAHRRRRSCMLARPMERTVGLAWWPLTVRLNDVLLLTAGERLAGSDYEKSFHV